MKFYACEFTLKNNCKINLKCLTSFVGKKIKIFKTIICSHAFKENTRKCIMLNLLIEKLSDKFPFDSVSKTITPYITFCSIYSISFCNRFCFLDRNAEKCNAYCDRATNRSGSEHYNMFNVHIFVVHLF